ncbi:MAG: hypothetical protein ACOX7X_12360 [Methanosarcina flavescens]|jgi:hypothetical protein|uniref:Uncharacterized protein n=1 Tax=Methanosarcina flavescens TaxID=1715806 RepID=A0A7K4AWF2_9EURY|nr:hypothetical protein [Methanosarcina flavescens]NLK32900.1 hypothetical protein [Methanosarcina flavescens]
MEEIFKGLVERAQYYEQFESYRYTSPSEHFGDMAALKLKAPAMSIT